MVLTPLRFKTIPEVNNYFFDIAETPVMYQDPMNKGVDRPYPGKKIIINKQLNEGISIVKNGFLSVKHGEAFKLGVSIFEMLFGVVPQIHKENLNAKSTDYSVDLISEKCKIVFDTEGYRFINEASSRHGSDLIEDRNRNASHHEDEVGSIRNHISSNYHDEYFPFIRVSNYLRDGNSFYIEMGYYRERCSNGMMLGRKTKMTFRHSYYVVNFHIVKAAAIDQFSRYKKSILNMAEVLWQLLSIHVSKAQMRLVSFDIFEKELIKKAVLERKRLQMELNDIIDKYVWEIGENLNAALNVATEFSKLLEGNKVSQSTIQNLSAVWVSKVTKRTFDLDSYLKGISDIEDRVMNAKEVMEAEEAEYDY